MSHQPSNRLHNENSSYLQQHAKQAIHWQPWDAIAIKRARDENKPILLSIGYSGCHWCQRMADDAFNDSDTVRYINDHFVSIKVDRQQRPDLDKVYQSALQILAHQSGGWPLTIFLTPEEQTPFFGGTYFPSQPQDALPAFKQILQQVHDFFKNHRDEIEAQNKELIAFFASANKPALFSKDELSTLPIDNCRRQLNNTIDHVNGGLKGAPKFFHTSTWSFLLLRHHHSKTQQREDNEALNHVISTLNHIAEGGIYDHANGGFFRYALDEVWSTPDTEKTLYDNALLLSLYSQVQTQASNPNYRNLMLETGHWLMNEMQAPDGGYYASWNNDKHNKTVLCAWHALAIKGMLQGGKTLNHNEFYDSAYHAIDFACQNFWRDNKLYTYYANHQSRVPAYSDDHAYFIDALVTALQVRWNDDYFQLALELAYQLLELFEDTHNGGLYYSTIKHHTPVFRPKVFSDDALPSSNGVATLALLRLSRLSNDQTLYNAAERILRAAWPHMNEYPDAHCSMLNALSEYLYPNKSNILE